MSGTAEAEQTIDEGEKTIRDAPKHEGLDDEKWATEIKQKHVESEQFETFLNKVTNSAHENALKTVFHKVTGTAQRDDEAAEKKRQEMEERTRKAEEAQKQAQQEANDAAKKAEEAAKAGLKDHNEEQPENFGKSDDKTEDMRNDINRLTPGGGTAAGERKNWTDADTVRSINGGVLLKGIFLVEDLDELLKEREKVIQVPDSLRLKGSSLPDVTDRVEFKSQKVTQTFENNTDKSSSTTGVSYFGFTVSASHSQSRSEEHEKEKSKTKEERYMSVINFVRVPVKAVDLSLTEMTLTTEVITQLKQIEAAIKQCDYESKGHFQKFFETFGSHVNYGVTEIGGILMSTAYCKGFSTENREKTSDIVSESSETALSIGFSAGGFGASVGTSFSASELHGKTKGQHSKEDMQTTNVTLRKFGGPNEINDQVEWKKELVKNSSLWQVIKRNNELQPIWELFDKHSDEFDDHVLLRDAMEKEYNKTKSGELDTKTCEVLKALATDIRKLFSKCPEGKYAGALVRDLENLKYRHSLTDEDWRKEVLYNTQIQSKIIEAKHHMTEMHNALERQQLITSLTNIMDPFDQIDPRHFPKFKEIQEACEKPQMLDISLWQERYKEFNEDSSVDCMKELVRLRYKHDINDLDWQQEVLYNAEKQAMITKAAKQMQETTDVLTKQQLATSLKNILHPIDQIQIKTFPNIKEVKVALAGPEDEEDLTPFTLDNITDLPDLLRKNLDQFSLKARNQLLRLEATIKFWGKDLKPSYEYLICLCILQLFGLNLKQSYFEFYIEKMDVEKIIRMLEQYFKEFTHIKDKKKKHAYILHIALSSPHRKQVVVEYMMDQMPGGLHDELQGVWKSVQHKNNTAKLARLQDEVRKCLHGSSMTKHLKALVQSLKVQFQSIRSRKKEETREPDRHLAQDETITEVDEAVQKLLTVLDMKKYYPQKLSYEDVITLTEDVFEDVNKKPERPRDQPWHFMKHIIGLDSGTRESSVLVRSQKVEEKNKEEPINSTKEDDWDDEWHEFEDAGIATEGDIENDKSTVHPLDLIYIIFLCADDFLRQELADKMSKCQYAVPLILPTPRTEKPVSKNSILHWSLKGISREFRQHGTTLHKTMVDAEAPLVSCISLGEDNSWKSKLLNKMLSPQQETFWHEELKGGGSTQKVSEGMVEVAWSLPGGRGDDTFAFPVTFTNLRGDALKHLTVCDKLVMSSSVTCIFTEKIDKEIYTFLKDRQPYLERILLIVLHDREEERKTEHNCKQLERKLNFGEDHIIHYSAIGANFHDICKALENSLKIFAEKNGPASVSGLVSNVKTDNSMDVDDKQCHLGEMAALNILKDIDEFNRRECGSAKAEILPCQSDISAREQLGKYDKELCRQKDIANKEVSKYTSEIKMEKWNLQLQMLQNPVSESFKYFLQCLLSLDSTNRKYFLQSLKLGLNDRSIKLLQPLRDLYQKCRLEAECKEKQERLDNISKDLTHGSLGLEHFFREMAVVYENIAALKNHAKSEELEDALDALASVMADMLLKGTAVEILDGDAMHSPVGWLSAVMNKVQNCCSARLFKVSVLGAQSCGKSTILNTAFGLNFPVSSGRCTRGAYMQLVRIDENLRDKLKCDFLLVIDSEGLMSRSMSDRSGYDNELATFVIGLSDLTLVIIKGEGNEMQDVLPIAIHVFLRMNKVGEQQACRFVHQNMGAVGAMSAIQTEIDAFVKVLDEKTLAAATDAEQSNHYKSFKDVLHYDSTKDNTYVPGLWDGTPPMAKTNIHYSSTMQQMKADIMQRVLAVTKVKSCSTLSDFADWLEKIWEAIKYENFVFSFNNVLAIEAHRKLNEISLGKQWKITQDIRNMIQDKETHIENEVMQDQLTVKKEVEALSKDADVVDTVVDSSNDKDDDHRSVNKEIETLCNKATNDIKKKIDDSIDKLKECMKHYFKCTGQGCKENDCSKEVRNRHLIKDNEKDFLDDIARLKKVLGQELETSMDTLKAKLKTTKRINEMSTEMDAKLKSKVQEEIRKRKGKDLTADDIENAFNRLWTDATDDIMRDIKKLDTDKNIPATVQQIVINQSIPNDHLCRRKLAKEQQGFVVHKVHMQLKGKFARLKDTFVNQISKEDKQRLKEDSKSIMKQTEKYYEPSAKGKAFVKKDAERLFEDVLQRINQIKHEKFETTQEYKLDLLIHIKNLAIDGFVKSDWRFNLNSPTEEPDRNIEETVEEIIKSFLSPEISKYQQRLGFVVNDKHLKRKGFWASRDDNDKKRLKDASDNIVNLTKRYYKLSQEGKEFVKKDAEMLFKDVSAGIEKIQDEKFETTPYYRADLLVYIHKFAVDGFEMMQERYDEISSPRALLDKKKKGFHDIYETVMKQGDSAVTFSEKTLKDIVLKNVDYQLTPNELLGELRGFGGYIFKNLQGLQAIIMIDLYRENNFEKYCEYITMYETVVERKLEQKSLECLKDRLHKLACVKLRKILDVIEEAINVTVGGPCKDKDFIATFFSNIRNLKIPHDEIASLDLLPVDDKRQFAAVVNEQLTGPVREMVEEDIRKWNVKHKLDDKGLTDFLVKEVVGCTERCPFCAVPCDTHTGGKQSGNHFATLHRPQGLGGMVWSKSEKLVVEDCRMSIASNNSYFIREVDGKKVSTPYRNYTKIHPTWTIPGDADPDAEKYWKWVLAQHNAKFAEYQGAKKGDIPSSWAKYNEKEIKEDIEKHYHVKLDK